MVAIRKDTVLATNFTQATLFAAIKAAMLDAGFSNPIDDYTSGTDRIAVYAFVTDSTKTYGTTYYRIRVNSAFAILHTIFQTWNSTTHVGTNGSLETFFSALSNTNTATFTALNGGSEYKFVFITQGSAGTAVPLGAIAPVTKPNWWDLNTWNYAFIWNAVTLNTFASTALNPYGASTYTCIINNTSMASPNPNNQLDVFTGLLLLGGLKGIAGKTSDDLGSGCVSASSRFATISTENINQNLLIINPVSGGLVIKI